MSGSSRTLSAARDDVSPTLPGWRWSCGIRSRSLCASQATPSIMIQGLAIVLVGDQDRRRRVLLLSWGSKSRKEKVFYSWGQVTLFWASKDTTCASDSGSKTMCDYSLHV